MMRSFIVFLFVLMAAATPALAVESSYYDMTYGDPQPDSAVNDAMNDMYRALGADGYDNALRHVQDMADAGNAEAAFRLGRWFDLESNTPDYKKAMAYYQRAFEKGHAWAENNIGYMYERGAGVEQNTARARKMYEEAARAGNVTAYRNLARVLFYGIGGAADDPFRPLKDGMDRGDAAAYRVAGALTESGDFGIPQNRKQAMAFYQKAADQGDRHAAEMIAEIYLYGACEGGWLRRMADTANCVWQDAGKGLQLLHDLADRGYPQAMQRLAQAYKNGVGVARDADQAVNWWKKASAKGDCVANRNLAWVYQGGQGVPQDMAQASQYAGAYLKCDPLDVENAGVMGQRYRDGKGVAKSCTTAENLFRHAIALGDQTECADLGHLYEGETCAPVKHDEALAFKVYLEGAKHGVAVCQNNVGAMLKHGRGRPKDLVKGYAWLLVAASGGSGLAAQNLKEFDYLFTDSDKQQGTEYASTVRSILDAAKNNPALAKDPAY